MQCPRSDGTLDAQKIEDSCKAWFPLYLEMQDGAALRVVERGRAVKEAEEEGDGGGAGDDLEAEAP